MGRTLALPPLPWPLEGVEGERRSGLGDTDDLSLDLELGGRGGSPDSRSVSPSDSVTSELYSMKLSSRKEIFPGLQ